MVFGKDKKELEDLRKEVEKLRLENRKYKEQLPQIAQISQLLNDIQGIGAGMIEVRRIDPDSVFLSGL